ncbi:MATE family efflux transporter [Cellulosilyticum sp. I15G10I2]|uniref:MATE family efflux transporter n=1 Tax=Cellulosilyticum sp. I15G10I2 TaxID=1892843 RepID=UPI00085C36D2|nr:MATE family efflux transporter [Cellulosilyticum sp. I15G10I2]
MEMQQNNCLEQLKDPTREAFLTHSLGALMVKNIFPAVSAMIFLILYQMADAILIGRRLGPEALASVNILYPILAVLSGIAIMIGVGGNVKIAVLLGKEETDQAGGVLSLLVSLGITIGIICGLIITLALPYVLSLLGTNGILQYYAGEYLKVISLFFVPMILIFILEQAVRNDGRPNMATGVMGLVAILNIILDYLFLFKFDMGMAGAALATGISQCLGASIFVSYLIYKTLNKSTGLKFEDIKTARGTLMSIAMNGSSELLSSLALGVTTFIYNKLILSYVGMMGVAAFSLVQYFMLFGTAVFMGMGNGTQPIISYNYGGECCNRVWGTVKRLMISSVITAFAIFMFLRWQTEALVNLFIPNHPEALDLALQVTNYLSWSILLMPVGIIGSAFFTAVEKPGMSLIIAVSRGLIFTLIGLWTLPLLWGEMGIWITPVFAEGITALIACGLIIFWRYNLKRVPKEAGL